MKTHMERHYPILLDIGTQLENNPEREYVFFYDDGSIYRAFLCSGLKVGKYSVQALDSTGTSLVTVPSDTPWRYIHKSNIHLVTGGDMERVELTNVRQKRDIQKEMIKSLGLDKKEDEDGEEEVIKHEYEKGHNPRQYL